MSLNLHSQEEESNREESIDEYRNLFMGYDNNPPTLSESLIQMFESCKLDHNKLKELTEDILSKCKKK